jgi:hypothetical protein
MSQNKYSFLKESVVWFILFSFSIIIVKSLGFTMIDDGWRHWAMASMPNEVVSWERVFHNSLFTNYDPWFMWHKLLSVCGELFGDKNIYWIINSISYFTLSLWYYLILTKLSNINKLFIIFLSIFLPILSIRYLNLRPETLSGFFVLYTILFSSNIAIFIVSILYAPFYYVYWFFMGYVGYIKLITKEYKAMFIIGISLLLGTAFHLYYDAQGFIYILKLVLANDQLRGAFSVGESYPMLIPLEVINKFGSSFVLIFLILFSLLIYAVFKPQDKLLKYIILFLPLMLIQKRFFYILEPILLAWIVTFTYKLYFDILNGHWNEIILKLKTFFYERTLFGKIGTKTYHVIIIFLISLTFLISYSSNKKVSKYVEKELEYMNFIENNEFKGTKIFLPNMSYDMQMMLYKNPSASYFPSCALGWVNFDEEFREKNLNLLMSKDISTEDFFKILKMTDSDFLIITPNAQNKNINVNTDNLSENGYIFYKIINGYVIFKKIDS